MAALFPYLSRPGVLLLKLFNRAALMMACPATVPVVCALSVLASGLGALDAKFFSMAARLPEHSGTMVALAAVMPKLVLFLERCAALRHLDDAARAERARLVLVVWTRLVAFGAVCPSRIFSENRGRLENLFLLVVADGWGVDVSDSTRWARLLLWNPCQAPRALLLAAPLHRRLLVCCGVQYRAPSVELFNRRRASPLPSLRACPLGLWSVL